jgi:predicted sugar kinase
LIGPAMPSPLAELLAALAHIFERLSLRWYLFGAQAAIVHGAARLTGDVDATVDLGGLTTGALVAALQDGGFTLRASDVDGFVERTHVVPLVHVASGMPADIVLAGPGLEELFLQRAQVHMVEGVAIPVACAEDIVAMKILAGRPKDIDDVVAILAASDAIQVELIRDTLRLLEGALVQSDLLPAFEQALRQARQ